MAQDQSFEREDHVDPLVQETRSLPPAPPVKHRNRMRVEEEGKMEERSTPHSYSDELKRL
ncbi:hypothetical protein [Desmospora activa]|uniref:Uncharacterized protein n=1 Tax=Desmospora activa DSM 45169 TaxID=1121389 RepID=A0A2T4ZD48_9BACL|nr:hypothetical protein [Desmospora activa]PTM59814.1 hypothetical protein C8J48_2446 [Desmospora activa DSM 45169]